MTKLTKYEQVKVMYLTGKIEREIAHELKIAIHKVRMMVAEIVSELNEIKCNRDNQIKNIEKYLFMLIEQEKQRGIKNKEIDSIAFAYSTFLL